MSPFKKCVECGKKLSEKRREVGWALCAKCAKARAAVSEKENVFFRRLLSKV